MTPEKRNEIINFIGWREINDTDTGNWFQVGELDRFEIRPISTVYTRIRPVRRSWIRPVPWFSCVYTAERNEFRPGSIFVWYRVNGSYTWKYDANKFEITFICKISNTS
jgi:hypothetical protein